MIYNCEKDSTSWTDPNPTGLPAAEITNINPAEGFAGSTIDIYGNGFSTVAPENMVLFDFSPGVVLEADENHLQVRLPMINDKSLPVKIAVQGSEFWGNWQDLNDTTLTMIDTVIVGLDTTITETTVDTTLVSTLNFTFLQALFTIADSVFLPYGITSDVDENVYVLVNQISNDYVKGIYQIDDTGNMTLFSSKYIQGNLLIGPENTFYANNLRRNSELGWISSKDIDYSDSWSKYIRNIVKPSGLDIHNPSRTMYATTFAYYEDNSYVNDDDSLIVNITDISSYLYWISMDYIDAYKINEGSSIKFDEVDMDTTSGIHRYPYSRATSCKVYDGYLYVTQAGNADGAAIQRHMINVDGLGPEEVVLDNYDDIYYLEFDTDGNMYFVPEGSNTLIRYNLNTGSVDELYPGDIVDTATYMCWAGDYLYLVFSNIPQDDAQTLADEPGIIQKVFIGAEGYVSGR